MSNIIEFIDQSLQFKPFPVQRVVLKAIHGVELDDKSLFEVRLKWQGNDIIEQFTEAGYLSYLFRNKRSNIEQVIPGEGHAQSIIATGRRAGKSGLIGVLVAHELDRLLQIDDPQAHYGMSPNDSIQVLAMATSKHQADLLAKAVQFDVGRVLAIQGRLANTTQSMMRFQTATDIACSGSHRIDPKALASIKLSFRSCMAQGLKGCANIAVFLDELAHYVQEGTKTDEEIIAALTPTMTAFSPKDQTNPSRAIGPHDSRLVALSTPAGPRGAFYNMFKNGMEAPKSHRTLCLQIPTWEMNPNIPTEHFAAEYAHLGHTKFWIEYGASFSKWPSPKVKAGHCVTCTCGA